MSVLRAIKNIYRKLSIRLFGNTVSLKINLLYFIYIFNLKIKKFLQSAAPGKSDNHECFASPAPAEIRNIGFSKLFPVLSSSEMRNISNKVSELFSDNNCVIHSLQDGGLLRLKDSLVNVPELTNIILEKNVSETIKCYYGLGFKIFSCDIYRTFPVESESAPDTFGSLKWHFDNCPASLLKVMVYLTDTTEETGAITLVPKGTSQKLKVDGFWDRNITGQHLDVIEGNSVTLEGEAGTVLLFSTHHCIHKATLPRHGYRDVAVFLIQPAAMVQKEFTDNDLMKYSRNYGYCVNPFTDKPLRFGDE